jgi:hypothetical protein
MLDLEKLPLVMTPGQVRKYIRDCTTHTLRLAYLRGEITGIRTGRKRTLYHTKSVLRWLGLLEAEPASAAPQSALAARGGAFPDRY